uniref:Uncharacterized protein n=1 Tax=Ditylenchus dipsaci TaxID=166011 RepID=A0A915CQ87_9BILA
MDPQALRKASITRRASVQEMHEAFPKCDNFLLKKWEHIFSVFFDRSHSHQLNWDDFYLVVKNARKIYGADSQQYAHARSSLQALWSGLCKLADSDSDQLITLDEWIELLQKVDMKNRNEPRWFDQYQDFMFKLFDVGEDGFVDQLEYTDGMTRPRGNQLTKVDPVLWKEMFLELFFSTDKSLPPTASLETNRGTHPGRID